MGTARDSTTKDRMLGRVRLWVFLVLLTGTHFCNVATAVSLGTQASSNPTASLDNNNDNNNDNNGDAGVAVADDSLNGGGGGGGESKANSANSNLAEIRELLGLRTASKERNKPIGNAILDDAQKQNKRHKHKRNPEFDAIISLDVTSRVVQLCNKVFGPDTCNTMGPHAVVRLFSLVAFPIICFLIIPSLDKSRTIREVAQMSNNPNSDLASLGSLFATMFSSAAIFLTIAVNLYDVYMVIHMQKDIDQHGYYFGRPFEQKTVYRDTAEQKQLYLREMQRFIAHREYLVNQTKIDYTIPRSAITSVVFVILLLTLFTAYGIPNTESWEQRSSLFDMNFYAPLTPMLNQFPRTQQTLVLFVIIVVYSTVISFLVSKLLPASLMTKFEKPLSLIASVIIIVVVMRVATLVGKNYYPALLLITAVPLLTSFLGSICRNQNRQEQLEISCLNARRATEDFVQRHDVKTHTDWDYSKEIFEMPPTCGEIEKWSCGTLCYVCQTAADPTTFMFTFFGFFAIFIPLLVDVHYMAVASADPEAVLKVDPEYNVTWTTTNTDYARYKNVALVCGLTWGILLVLGIFQFGRKSITTAREPSNVLNNFLQRMIAPESGVFTNVVAASLQLYLYWNNIGRYSAVTSLGVSTLYARLPLFLWTLIFSAAAFIWHIFQAMVSARRALAPTGRHISSLILIMGIIGLAVMCMIALSEGPLNRSPRCPASYSYFPHNSSCYFIPLAHVPNLLDVAPMNYTAASEFCQMLGIERQSKSQDVVLSQLPRMVQLAGNASTDASFLTATLDVADVISRSSRWYWLGDSNSTVVSPDVSNNNNGVIDPDSVVASFWQARPPLEHSQRNQQNADILNLIQTQQPKQQQQQYQRLCYGVQRVWADPSKTLQGTNVDLTSLSTVNIDPIVSNSSLYKLNISRVDCNADFLYPMCVSPSQAFSPGAEMFSSSASRTAQLAGFPKLLIACSGLLLATAITVKMLARDKVGNLSFFRLAPIAGAVLYFIQVLFQYSRQRYPSVPIMDGYTFLLLVIVSAVTDLIIMFQDMLWLVEPRYAMEGGKHVSGFFLVEGIRALSGKKPLLPEGDVSVYTPLANVLNKSRRRNLQHDEDSDAE